MNQVTIGCHTKLSHLLFYLVPFYIAAGRCKQSFIVSRKNLRCIDVDLPFCSANCSLLSLCCFADLEVGLLVCSAVVAAEPGTEEEDLRAMGWAYSLPVVASATITGTLLPTGVPTSPPATAMSIIMSLS